MGTDHLSVSLRNDRQPWFLRNSVYLFQVDPMIKIFPRMTKCIFRKGGPSMNIETHDALCILPLNVVNEKIYIFLWFWFLILGFLSTLTILYRFVVFVSPRIRGFVIGKFYQFNQSLLLHFIN